MEQDKNYKLKKRKKSGIAIGLASIIMLGSFVKLVIPSHNNSNDQNEPGISYTIDIARDDEFSKNHKFKHSYWRCKCECGNDVTIYLGHLQNGHTTSCGCDKSSKGEKEITQILEENNINFIHDKQYFKDLLLPSGGIGRYDYIIFNEDNSVKCIIEFDGEQHYRDGWNSLETVQLNDEAKNKYAFSHHIPIIRIPYWERGNITLSLLFDGTYELSPDMEEAQDEV